MTDNVSYSTNESVALQNFWKAMLGRSLWFAFGLAVGYIFAYGQIAKDLPPILVNAAYIAFATFMSCGFITCTIGASLKLWKEMNK